MKTYIALLSASLLAGCSAQGALTAASTAAGQAPQVIGAAEQLKSALQIAPIAGCVELLQQTQMQLQALQNGTPGIPVSQAPDVPPIITVPPYTPPSSPSPSFSPPHLRYHSTAPAPMHKQVAAQPQDDTWQAVQRLGRAEYERRNLLARQDP